MHASDFKVFVYGTLKPGGRYWQQYCEGKVLDPIPTKIHGTLYDMHVGYPGLRLGGDDWVQGYLLSFQNEADLLRLDYLEGYAPERPEEQNEYMRLRVACYDTSGALIGEVWTYEITTGVMDELGATLIADGNWPI